MCGRHGGSHLKDKDEEVGLLVGAAKLNGSLLDVLLELGDGVLQGGAGVVNLVDNQDVLADKIRVLDGAEVEPLGARDGVANGLLGALVGELLVQREADRLDGDVGASGRLEERAQDARGDVSSASDTVAGGQRGAASGGGGAAAAGGARTRSSSEAGSRRGS